MRFDFGKILKVFFGTLFVIVGLILMPVPIIPGILFVLIGAVMLGWITRKRLKRLEKQILSQSRTKVNKVHKMKKK